MSCNFFAAHQLQHVEPCTRLPRLTVLKLYGNQLLGPTCEDPLYMHIEPLVDDAIAYRDTHAPHMTNIDFITEFPRPKNMKKGQALGRQAMYRDFAIVQVDAGAVQTNRAWRARGNRTIFAETMQKKRRGTIAAIAAAAAPGGEFGLANSSSGAGLPDTTFLTSSHALGPSGALMGISGGGGASPHHNAHHGAHHHHNKTHDAVADDVMQRVAGEMGLVSSAELLLLQDRATIRSS